MVHSVPMNGWLGCANEAEGKTCAYKFLYSCALVYDTGHNQRRRKHSVTLRRPKSTKVVQQPLALQQKPWHCEPEVLK